MPVLKILREEETGIIIPTINVNCTYKSHVTFGDTIFIKTYLKSFLIASLKFSGKSSLVFWGVIVLITILDYKLGNTFNLVLSDVLLGNVAISAIFGYVEFYSVSQYFYSVLRGYKGNIDNDIELTKKLYALGNLHELYLIDHLIIGKDTYYSFYENNNILNNN